MTRKVSGAAGWRGYKPLVTPAVPKSLSPVKDSQELGSWSPVQILKVALS